MRTAIITTYHGPTDHKPSRITAKARKGRGFSLTASYYSDTPEGNYGPHRRAAQALAERLGWSGTWAAGMVDNGPCCWVNVGSADLTGTLPAGPCFYVAPRAEATK